MALRWPDVEQFTVEMATADLARRGEIHPLLVAFADDQQGFLAFLRPFAKGRYHNPMIELLSLAMALDCDRLAFAAGGRLTSLDDPIPPVTDGADLRQRALVVTYADGAQATTHHHSVIHPFTLDGSRVLWGEAVRLAGGQGWISSAMKVAVDRRADLATVATDADTAFQAERCVRLGHELFLGPEVGARLV